MKRALLGALSALAVFFSPMKILTSRFAIVLLAASSLAVGVGSAAGQSGSSDVVRTYDVRIVGTVTTTAPDTVFVEKATQVYNRVQVRVGGVAGRPIVFSIDQSEKGVMSGEVNYQKTGSAPCSQSKRFRGAARLQVSGAGGRSVSVFGGWAGAPGGAYLMEREWECPGLFDMPGVGHVWDREEGRLMADFASYGGGVSWLLPRAGGRLPFPMDRLYAGKSFAAIVSGPETEEGLPWSRTGTIRVTLTPRG
jgi:hypothetical protein